MPVVDSVFVPRAPLVLAEQTVDYAGLHDHVSEQRALVEASTQGLAKRLAASAVMFEIPNRDAIDALAHGLEQALRRTLRFGYKTARAEVEQLRRTSEVRAAYVIPDAGEYARIAAQGLEGIRALIQTRTRTTSHAISTAALAAAGTALVDDPEDDTARLLAVAAAVTRILHNHVLELVGEVLNLGRTAGAMTMREPPEFAMRSEQLDKGTCDACSRLHGEIVEVGSSSYFEYLPPAGCRGGGRCRGVMVFADGPEQMRGPETAPELAPIPPVRLPERRVA